MTIKWLTWMNRRRMFIYWKRMIWRRKVAEQAVVVTEWPVESATSSVPERNGRRLEEAAGLSLR